MIRIRSVRALSLLASATFLGACVVTAGQAHMSAVSQRASYDFQCAEEQVQVSEIGGNSYVANGCGKKQIYNCAGNTSTCVPETSQLPPSAPPPPANR